MTYDVVLDLFDLWLDIYIFDKMDESIFHESSLFMFFGFSYFSNSGILAKGYMLWSFTNMWIFVVFF